MKSKLRNLIQSSVENNSVNLSIDRTAYSACKKNVYKVFQTRFFLENRLSSQNLIAWQKKIQSANVN